MEILELKNILTEIKTTIGGFNRLVTAELYNNPIGNTSREAQRRKNKGKYRKENEETLKHGSLMCNGRSQGEKK